MSLVTGSVYAGLSDRNGAPVISGLFAGEALKAAAPCYIKSDGEVYECVGTSGSAASCPMGFTPRSYLENEPVSLYGAGAIFQYNASLTKGAVLYINATAAGMLDTAKTIGDKHGVAVALDANNIIVTRSDGRTATEV